MSDKIQNHNTKLHTLNQFHNTTVVLYDCFSGPVDQINIPMFKHDPLKLIADNSQI